MRHQQWRVEQNHKRDTARAEAIEGIIIHRSNNNMDIILYFNFKKYFNAKISFLYFTEMIDRWSVIHVVAVVAMGIVQVVILRRFFNMQPGKYKMAARAWRKKEC